MNNTINRREVLRRALILTGAAGSVSLLTACENLPPRTDAAGRVGDLDIPWLDEVAETILPETDTPGAKAAQVGAFIALMVADTLSPEEQEKARQGMADLEARCVAEHGSGFMETSPESRLALLETLDRERIEDPDHYFGKLKEWTVFGYFTSEIGYTQALRYLETPGRFDPCVDVVPGEPMWARHA